MKINYVLLWRLAGLGYSDCMIRLAHLSDVHVYVPRARWQPRDWFNKRLTGWLNLRCLGRGHRFRHAATVLKALSADIYERKPDCIIFSGDATALGFEEELAEVAALLRVGQTGGLPGIAAPGNHDYYTVGCAASYLFEQYFAPWLEGQRIDGATYPFARRVGPVWLIGLNSSQGNRWFWDATGRVGEEQLGRLRRLLAQLGDKDAPRILVTHYPVACADGTPENRAHLLHDLPNLIETAQDGNIALWLHGHRHEPYFLLPSPTCNIPSLCAGSGTQEGLWTYAEHAFDGKTWQVSRRCYQPATQRFEEGERFDVSIV
jgi:3',5'-cyclic AMP phosphodiesterase CpdA